jgi:hypothetical protein
MSTSIDDLLAEWRINLRLRLGVLAIAAIVGGFFIDRLMLYHGSLKKEYIAQLKNQRQYEQLATQNEWLERAQNARALQTKIEASLWQAASPGLAEAAVQSWFTRRLHSLELDSLRIDVGELEKLEQPMALWRVPVAIKAAADRGQIISLLERLELNDKLLAIEQFEAIRSRKRLRINLIVAAYFLPADAQPPEDSS